MLVDPVANVRRPTLLSERICLPNRYNADAREITQKCVNRLHAAVGGGEVSWHVITPAELTDYYCYPVAHEMLVVECIIPFSPARRSRYGANGKRFKAFINLVDTEGEPFVAIVLVYTSYVTVEWTAGEKERIRAVFDAC